MKIDNSIFDYAPKHIQDNKTFYKKAKAGILARPYIYLENLHEKFRDDKDIVLKAVGEYHIFIVDASPRLRKDYDVSMLAVEKTRANGDIEWLINELDDNLLKNPKFVLEAISKNPDFIKFTDKSFRSDKKFMLSAIEIDPNTYKYADPVLKNDVDFVLDALIFWVNSVMSFLNKITSSSKTSVKFKYTGKSGVLIVVILPPKFSIWGFVLIPTPTSG